MRRVARQVRPALLPVGATVLLTTSALLPITQPAMITAGHSAAAAVRGALNYPGCLIASGMVGLLAAPFGLRRLRLSGIPIRSMLPAARLVLHLWPVIILTITYPIAARGMAGHEVGGVRLTTFLLAAAVTIPWIVQGICMPLYRVVGPVIASNDRNALSRRFCAAWPTSFVQTLPVSLIFALPLSLIMHWSPTAVGAQILLVVLDVIFAQSLVLANIGRSRLRWALAWTGYAVPILIVPWAWYLPPLLGLLVQLIPLTRHLLTRPVWLPVRELAADVLRGLLLGSVLWADKVFYFYQSGEHFPAVTVFLALLPAIVAYNYYFICTAPGFDASVNHLRSAMEGEPIPTLRRHVQALTDRVFASLRLTAFVGAASVFICTQALVTAELGSAALIASVSIASWLFMMTTILCYKLDYIGEKTLGQALSAAHLLLCVAAFSLLPAGAVAYVWLTGTGFVVFTIALYACRKAWRTPQYTLFWRHALAW